MTKYRVEVYYKGGGTTTYPVIAPNVSIAKWLGHEMSRKWEPNIPVKKVTAKKLTLVKLVTHSVDPEKPFGDPFDDTEDLYAPPRLSWVSCK